MKKYLGFLISLSIVDALAVVHTVQKRETLSELCQNLVPGRIYGKNGSLKKVLGLNPSISDRDRVYPGQKINFPEGTIVSQEVVKSLDPIEEVKKTIASEDKPSFASYSRLYALVGSEYFQIQSKDKTTGGKADFASNSSPRMDLIWELSWTPEYTSRIFFSRVMESIMDDSRSGRSLKNAKGNRDSFGFEMLKKVSEETSFGLYVARSTRSLARAISPTVLTFDRVNGFELGAKVEKALFKMNKATVSANAKAAWLAPTKASDYSVKSGKTALAGLTLRHELRSITLEAQAYYGYWDQDSKFSKQSSTQVGMGIGASWRFDE